MAKIGSIVWRDLTVPDADAIRDFYRDVVGWQAQPVDMGEYSDFTMLAPGDDQPAAGICFARGANADLPAQWLLYVMVEDVEASARTCVERGGAIVTGPRSLGEGMFCVIRDPAGAVCALYSTPSSD
jgi:predicted enzyme related to lactoylglutathione lyase